MITLCKRRDSQSVFLWLASFLFSGLIVLGITGCGTSPAPVSARTPPASEQIKHHIVAPGETLHAIAWRYELAANQLAAANGIKPPYRLRAGQRLTLNVSYRPPPSSASRSPSRTGNKVHTVSRGETLYSIARRYQLSVGQLAKANGLASPYILHVGQRLSLSRGSSKTGVTRKVSTSKTKKTSVLPPSGWKWRWPVKGKVSRFYDSNRVFKGINIQSRSGYAVIAAAPGVVVYAGDGLRGYGRLIIIKHSDIYLSAYAHNRKILVKEGAVVKAKSKIAEVGGDSSNPGRLYFEIRKNGKPVDPLRLLPTQ